MKTKLAFLVIFAFMGVVLISPASAGPLVAYTTSTCTASYIYCNTGSGSNPNNNINGNTDAWTINFGFIVSDEFTTTGATATGADIALWLEPGDTSLSSLDWSVTTAANGGTTEGSATATSFGSTDEGLNSFDYEVWAFAFSFGNAGITLAPGTYWLNLQNAAVPSGDPVYWDENSGPSLAYENSVGSIPSEAFAINGGTSSTPEPGSLGLLSLGGSGLLLLAGALRRKLLKR